MTPDPVPPTTPPADPPAPPSGEPPAPPAVADPPAPAEPLDAAATTRELAQARKDAGKYRAELTKMQADQKLADQAKLTEEEKRVARVAELEALLADREKALKAKTGYAAVVDAAARLGAAKPAMLHRLVESEIEFDDDGAPKNVDALIKDFLKINPEFAASAGHPTGDAGQGARGRSTLTRDDIKKMSPDQINARWAEVSEVLGRGA